MMRWMLFVDGENLALRAQAVAKELQIELAHESTYHVRDAVFWSRPDARILAFRDERQFQLGGNDGLPLLRVAERALYYTSMSGGHNDLDDVRRELHRQGWTARLFKRKKQEKRKQVDIHLTTEALEHAYRDNYDVAVLVTGDRDFIPLVEALQRAGKRVVLARLPQESAGVSSELALACDYVENLWVRLDVGREHVEAATLKLLKTAEQKHRLPAGSCAQCDRPLQISRQSDRSGIRHYMGVRCDSCGIDIRYLVDLWDLQLRKFDKSEQG